MTYNEHRQVMQRLDEIERKIDAMASTVNAGLAALQQADSDLAAAIAANTAEVNAAVADIQSLSQQLSTATSGEDSEPAVASIAADLETKVAALSAATTALTASVTPTPPPAS